MKLLFHVKANVTLNLENIYINRLYYEYCGENKLNAKYISVVNDALKEINVYELTMKQRITNMLKLNIVIEGLTSFVSP